MEYTSHRRLGFEKFKLRDQRQKQLKGDTRICIKIRPHSLIHFSLVTQYNKTVLI